MHGYTYTYPKYICVLTLILSGKSSECIVCIVLVIRMKADFVFFR